MTFIKLKPLHKGESNADQHSIDSLSESQVRVGEDSLVSNSRLQWKVFVQQMRFKSGMECEKYLRVVKVKTALYAENKYGTIPKAST